MFYEYIPILETLGFDLLIAALFLLIALAIRDVLKQGKVPPFGQFAVWFVLFLGCFGFILKGILKLLWQDAS
ncbi:hypothetical protein VST7929_01768 [Vibrio stylophorae]|uniref:DUF2788 domain-containing protein n=1 Tax=Vibrio stylophorae TaxID=659351 RepID=A0ABM8ZUB1_9VIBR|nr:DUF2788 domain-containing protein [Vibrio stylophorae]CAH0533891.1 hypothetical protein VST7929_01768 [Vibrio stylophorae]